MDIDELERQEPPKPTMLNERVKLAVIKAFEHGWNSAMKYIRQGKKPHNLTIEEIEKLIQDVDDEIGD